MKRTLYILPLAVCCLLFSCTKYLDMPSDGRVDLKVIFAQRNTIIGYYMSLYGTIPSVGFTYNNGSNPAPLAVFCDEAEDVNNRVSGSTFDWYNGNVSANYNPLYNGDESNYAWNYYFEAIRRCNTFLQNIPQNTATDIRDFEVAAMIAEVRVIRAYLYLQLIKRYGGVPLTTTPYDAAHDYSQEKRTSFEEIADFIIAECDSALATPENEGQDMSFLWRLRNDNQRGKIPRAFALAVKSQTALYAASPLWNNNGSSKYTWDVAAAICKDALDLCIEHGYMLYDNNMTDAMKAKTLNTYGYYFVQRSDVTRSLDRETIFEAREQANIWMYATLPIWQGGITAGACPSQELVDAYETIDGQPVLDLTNPYNDINHLQPNYNTSNTTYDRNNPYENRDPRFYASIYYNGAMRNWKEYKSQYLRPHFSVSPALRKNLTRTANADNSVTLTTTGTESYIETVDIGGTVSDFKEAYIVFEYKSNRAVTDAHITAVTGVSTTNPILHSSPDISLPQADDWVSFRYDLAEFREQYGFGEDNRDGTAPNNHRLRFNPSWSDGNGYQITVRNWEIQMENPLEPLTFVETFVGSNNTVTNGNCAISQTTTNTRNTRTGYYMRKFNSVRSEIGSSDDGYFKIFRLAELYLNFAEAAYNATGPDNSYNGLSAVDALNEIRDRAGMPELPSGMSKDEFERRYRNERRVELAFEEHRFFDVRRWKILEQTDRGVSGMQITKDENENLTYQRIQMVPRQAYTNKYLMFPVPQSDVSKMLEYTGVNWQNPGWD